MERNKLFLNEKQVEGRIGVPIKTLQTWRLLGRGPKWRKLGRAIRYGVDDLEDWIDAQPSGGGGK